MAITNNNASRSILNETSDLYRDSDENSENKYNSDLTSVSETVVNQDAKINTYIKAVNRPTENCTAPKWGLLVETETDSEFNDGGQLCIQSKAMVTAESGGCYYLYGTSNEAHNYSENQVSFLQGQVIRASTEGTGSYLRGSSTDVVNNGNVDWHQGQHIAIENGAGSTSKRGDILYLDLDNKGGEFTEGFSYLYIGNDGTPTVNGGNGQPYAIESDSTLPSKFAGSIQIGESSLVNEDSTSAGSIRYVETANRSAVEMLMKTGASAYSWVVIQENTF